MAQADNPIPEYKTYAEGAAIPPVDPEDIKRMRPRVRTEGEGWSWHQDMKAKLSPVAGLHGGFEPLRHDRNDVHL